VLWLRKSPAKVRQRFALPLIETAFDLVDEHIPAPATLGRLADVPFSFRGAFYGIEDADLMAPWQLCNNLLHKFSIRIGLGQSPHISEIASFESGTFGECPAEVCSTAIDDVGAPSFRAV
jgi:hypothetical protein